MACEAYINIEIIVLKITGIINDISLLYASTINTAFTNTLSAIESSILPKSVTKFIFLAILSKML